MRILSFFGLSIITASASTCGGDDFQGECRTTNQCKGMYTNAFDCRNNEGGVCYCGDGVVCGCLEDEDPSPPPSCGLEDFQRECTSTNQCKMMYSDAFDCWNNGGGVCYCGGSVHGTGSTSPDGVVCGCKEDEEPTTLVGCQADSDCDDTNAGTVDTCDPSNLEANADGCVHTCSNLDVPLVDFSLVLLTDKYPYETAVKLTDLTTGETYWEDRIFHSEATEYTLTQAIDPRHRYNFMITDSESNGICCDDYGDDYYGDDYYGDDYYGDDAGSGYFQLFYDNEYLYSGGEFGSFDSYDNIGGFSC